jgi:cystathionine beta-lyase/cystathionine gamma-synthase
MTLRHAPLLLGMRKKEASSSKRQSAGIVQGMVRVAVGLDDVEDVKADLARGLATL